VETSPSINAAPIAFERNDIFERSCAQPWSLRREEPVNRDNGVLRDMVAGRGAIFGNHGCPAMYNENAFGDKASEAGKPHELLPF